MTQLIIDGTEAVLSEDFNVVVKRENSIITKNGEYTYDCTLSLENAINRRLFGFLHRLNKKGEVETRRSATLIADGHVFCRGTEVITGWTDKTVSIQIVSGASELNYFINGDELVSSLTGMGEIQGRIMQEYVIADNPVYGDVDFCLATIHDSSSGMTFNQWKPGPVLLGGSAANNGTTLRAQPYLCALLRRMITALGYTIGRNELETTIMKNVFIVNTVNTLKYCEMLPGWTAKEFLEEVEKLCNCIFTVDNRTKTCDILLKSSFYTNAKPVPMYKVVDEYTVETTDPEPEHSTSDVRYDIEDGSLQRLQSCGDMLADFEIVEANTMVEVMQIMATIQPTDKKVVHYVSSDKYFIRIANPVATDDKAEDTLVYIEEVNGFAPVIRDSQNAEAENVVEIGIVPVPMVCGAYPNGATYMEVPVIGTGSNIRNAGGSFGTHSFGGSGTTTSDDPLDEGKDVETLLMEGKSEEKVEKVKLYAALYNGYHKERNGWIAAAYTDSEHASRIAGLRYQSPMPWDYNYSNPGEWIDVYQGTLKLKDLDHILYHSAYTIDTTKAVTFTVFDKAVRDPREVVNIHNRLWAIREIEETIDARGRKPTWKLTCHSINITATGEQVRWVLEDGTWNDANPWFDLGKWNDEPEE